MARNDDDLGRERWEAWRFDPTTGPDGTWRCGDHLIAADPADPTRYQIHHSDGTLLYEDRIPPSGTTWWDEFTGFAARLADGTSDGELDGLATAGLETWWEAAQAAADEEYERRHQDYVAWRESRPGRTAEELRAAVPEEPDWLVPGVLHRRWSHKIGGREKQAGKGTLMTYLIGRLERGEATVFGAAAATASAVILTEEPPEAIREKLEAFDLRRSRIIHGWEYAALAWPEKAAALVQTALEDGHEIVFVDNLSRSARIEKEEGTELGLAFGELADACARAGLACVVDHHHRKAGGKVEDRSRGGTNLPGAADVNIEVERVGKRGSRKRRLTVIGRTEATNWERVIERNEAGTDYTEVEDPGDGETDREAEQEAQVLADAFLLPTDRLMHVDEFHALVGGSLTTARRRLRATTKAGLAMVIPGGRDPETGKQTPNGYRRAGAAAAATTQGLAAVAAAGTGSGDPA